MADKVVRLGVGLVVWVWLAQYLGPAQFGMLNYAIAYAALFSAAAGLGLDGIVVRELIRDESQSADVLGTAMALRLGAGLIAAVVCIVTAALLRPSDSLAIALVTMSSIVFVLQSSQIIDCHFQSRMRTRPAVLAVNGAFLLTSAGRLTLLAIEAPLLWFGISLVVEAALAAALLVVAYRADTQSIRRWQFRFDMARRLLSESWPLLLSGLAVMFYMRLDQIMLSAMVGDAEVGQFSAALRISEVWYFIPMAIVTAAFPAMMKKRTEGAQAYEHFLQMLYDGMAWLGVGVAGLFSVIGPWLIGKLYGSAFSHAAEVLSVQIWAGVAVSMSFVHGKWLLAEGLQKYGLVYTVAGALLNIGLNLMLIPKFGAVGAAWATLATQIGLLPMQIFFPRTRRNLLLMTRSIWAPYRLWGRRKNDSR